MQELARIAPERMERLALLDTGFRADSPDRAAMRRRLDGAARTPGQFHGFEEDLLQIYLHPKNVDNTAINGRIRDMTERLGAAVFLRQNAIERKDGAAVLATYAARSCSCAASVTCFPR